jgi:NADH dehydrogenase/NADH:ubiquinone oxidoreductase subunit G
MAKVTIDGITIEVAEGTTILNAARAIGCKLPHHRYGWYGSEK